MIFLSASFVVFLGYMVLITAITSGWLKLPVFTNQELHPRIKISLIVAVRDEALHINALLQSLSCQDYPSKWLEIIIVDDHSSDNTALLIEDFLTRQGNAKRMNLVLLKQENGSGKKAALNRGIGISGGELIVITDADCTAGCRWISEMAAFYAVHKPHMILGPVRMTDGGSLFGKLQSLEFTSLISSAAGSCQAGFPLLANGANMAFTRQAYESCGGFTSNLQFPSGDDMFLLMSIKNSFGSKAIRFLRSEAAIVNTPAVQGFKPFIQQRLRWVSKSRGYTDPLLIATSILVFLTNTCLLTAAFAALFIPGFPALFMGLYLVKLLVDIPLLLSYSRVQKSSSLLWLFPVMELINAVYTVVVGIAGNIWKYEWKGRTSSANPAK